LPEVADDGGWDLELLDDLAQLAALVEHVEDAGGDATFGRRVVGGGEDEDVLSSLPLPAANRQP